MSAIPYRPNSRLPTPTVPGLPPDAPDPQFKPGPRAATPNTWTFPEICAAYQWPANAPGTGVIAIGELGGGFGMAEMETYFKSIGQPMPTITVVSVDGTKNDNNSGDADIEVALDIQGAAASFFCATGRPAEIRVYFAQDIAPATLAAAKDGCAVMSWSWGADESQWGKTAADEMQAALVTANAAGMAVFCAAGDNSSDDGGGTLGVDLPAACPNAVACGGTTKPKSGIEKVWGTPGQPNGEGTGCGYSKFFAMPVWQKDGGAPVKAGLGRMVPDLCANADPQTGFEIFVHGKEMIIGGTSAVAPLMTGLFAALSKPGDLLGNVGEALWADGARSCFTDIVEGGSGAYDAAVGPDPASGMGTPIGTALAAFVEGDPAA